MTSVELQNVVSETLKVCAERLKRDQISGFHCKVDSDGNVRVVALTVGSHEQGGDMANLAYTQAVTQLRLHPEMIWKRNNFFLLVQGALLAAVTKDGFLAPGVATWLAYGSGLLVAVIWAWVTWAGQRIQRDWRTVVKEFERRAVGEGNGPFTWTSSPKEGAQLNISITTALLVLSFGFVVLWGIAIAARTFRG